MRRGIRPIVGVCLLLLGVSTGARAAEELREEVRGSRRFGAYLSIGGDPFPALWGVNLADHITDFLRFNAGIGTETSAGVTATTFGMGAKAFVPGWRLSPMVGLNWSIDDLSRGGSVVIRGIRRGGSRFSATFGADLQTAIGIDFGFGVAQAIGRGGGGSAFLNAGFFL